MSFWTYFLDLLSVWGKLFIAPFTNPIMLWIIIPMYLSWIFTEFYQEKKGTSLGNAVSNGVIVFWIGIDWARTLVNQLIDKTLKFNLDVLTKFFIALLVFAYGVAIIIEGVKGRTLTRFIGRIREVTYVVLMLTPIFYGAVPLSFNAVFAIILFFPLFYGIVELIDRALPTPKIYEEEEKYERELEEKRKEKEQEKELKL